jgi:hypothetical protein
MTQRFRESKEQWKVRLPLPPPVPHLLSIACKNLTLVAARLSQHLRDQ